jgi:hypothetical protein
MKLLKSLALLVCLQLPVVFAMADNELGIDAEPLASSTAGARGGDFPSMASLEKEIEQVAEPTVGVVLGFVMGPDGPARLIKQYTRRDVLEGLENINKGTSALVALLKTEQPNIVDIMGALQTIVGDDILTLKPHLLQVIWALYSPEPVLVVGNTVGTSEDDGPQVEELGAEDL